MDDARFDDLLRSLAAGASRRRLLTRLAGGLAGALAWGPTPAPTAARRPTRKQRRRCSGGRIRCGRLCVNVEIDERHCGGCGRLCPETDVCNSGVCRPEHCFDGVQNSDETDVDCGGDRCPRCAFSQRCEGHSDCASIGCADDGLGGKRCGTCRSNSACTNPASPYCERVCGVFPECYLLCVACRQDSDCRPNKPRCQNGECRECLTDAHCAPYPGFPACVNGGCWECHTNAECTDPAFPRCEDGLCLKCQVDGDCPPNEVCEEDECLPCGGEGVPRRGGRAAADCLCRREGTVFLECPGAVARCYPAGSHCCNPATQPVCEPPSTCNGTRCCDPGQTSCDQGQCCWTETSFCCAGNSACCAIGEVCCARGCSPSGWICCTNHPPGSTDACPPHLPVCLPDGSCGEAG